MTGKRITITEIQNDVYAIVDRVSRHTAQDYCEGMDDWLSDAVDNLNATERQLAHEWDEFQKLSQE